MRFLLKMRRKSNDTDEEILKFDPGDRAYKIGCNCSSLNCMLIMCLLQYFFAAYFLFFTVVQIIFVENYRQKIDYNEAIGRKDFDKSKLHRPPYFFIELGVDKLDILLWAPTFYPSVYFRLLVIFLHLLAIKLAVFALYKNKSDFLKLYVVVTCLYLVLLLAHVILLTWHSAKSTDHFSFCIVGLSLLSSLLVNVTSMNLAQSALIFMKSRRDFLQICVEKSWIDETFSRDFPPNNQRRQFSAAGFFPGCWFFFDLARRYEIPKELKSRARRELVRRNGEKSGSAGVCLWEIDEEDKENEQTNSM